MFPPDTRILLAEDTEITRAILKQMLQKLGFRRISEVDNGAAAWEEIERALRSQSPFKLAIIDWKMPSMNGLELLGKIQSYEETRGLPFILLTSNTEKEHVVEAIKAGVTAYIAKPFPVAVLEKKLKEAWEILQRKRVA